MSWTFDEQFGNFARMWPHASLTARLGAIIGSYMVAASHLALPLVALVALLLALTLTPARAWLGRSNRALRTASIVIAVILGLAWAWHLASMFDDAYISLRYARNLVRGHGLVFNVGERVEGYTNFLWTIILAGGLRLGIDGTRMAVIGDLVCFVAELLVVARVSRRLADSTEAFQLPIAVFILAGSYTFASFATGGLETMPATMLVTVALERALAGSLGWAGLAGILATMAHPDMSVLYAGMGLALALDSKTRRLVWRYGAPFALLYVPYFAWRWHYYGDLFPNTYYAKSASLTYFSQGTIYLLASGLASGAWAMAPLAAHALWRRPRTFITRYSLVAGIPYLLYVWKIGGDFMLGRLLVPILPLAAILAERGLRDILAEGRRAVIGAAAILLACAVLPVRLIGAGVERWYLTDERTWYRLVRLWPEPMIASRWSQRAEILEGLVRRGVHPLVADKTIGLEGYLTDLPFVDIFGLTDRAVAHQKLTERGRPGHEKQATSEYLRKRGVQLASIRLYPAEYNSYTVAWFDLRNPSAAAPGDSNGEPFALARYEPRLVTAMRSLVGAYVPDVPHLLDVYLSAAEHSRPSTLQQDAAFFREYYFSCNDDPRRLERLNALAAGSPKSASLSPR